MSAMRKDLAASSPLTAAGADPSQPPMATPANKPLHISKVKVNMQQQQQQTPPVAGGSLPTPETPVPDYEDDSPHNAKHRNSFKFVNNFQNIISNIRNIEEHYSNFPEPDPDYLNDDDDTGGSSSGGAAFHNHKQHHPQQRPSGGWRKPAPANGAGAGAAADDDTSGGEFPPPPPPLTADELAMAVSEAYDAQVQNGISPTAADDHHSGAGTSREEGGPPQILPKPLHNPCVDSRERQALHKELLLNYKIGKDVLQKPELNKVLRERRETQRKKEWDDQRSGKGRTSLEVKLEERRIKEEEAKMKVIKEDETSTPELTRIQRKILHKTSGEQS